MSGNNDIQYILTAVHPLSRLTEQQPTLLGVIDPSQRIPILPYTLMSCIIHKPKPPILSNSFSTLIHDQDYPRCMQFHYIFTPRRYYRPFPSFLITLLKSNNNIPCAKLIHSLILQHRNSPCARLLCLIEPRQTRGGFSHRRSTRLLQTLLRSEVRFFSGRK